jgi:hypothetical protein
MIRLDFQLPEWTRTIWNSQSIKENWETRLSRVSNAFVDIERKTVLAGIKPSCLVNLSPQEIPQILMELAGTPYTVVPLSKTNPASSYQSSGGTYDPNQPTHYRATITRLELAADWKAAWAASDDRRIGELLGFPSCCIDFFQKYWVEEKMLDTSWAMSQTGTEGPRECNILWRWLGVRAVSHLPCSFNCAGTYQLARQNIDFGRSIGYQQEMDWLEEILDWPVQWNALHGIAEIKTPILKISTRTDATADTVIVNRQGFSYPADGISGVNFPYVNKAKTVLTKTNAFRRSLLLENQWLDNGFSSFEAMNHSHQILLAALEPLKNTQFSIIDFGCGNAELLKSVQATVSEQAVPHGVELEPARYGRIKFNFPDHEQNFWQANMFDQAGWQDGHYNVAVVMPGRLTEVSASEAAAFVNWLNTHVDQVVFYAYGDWVQRIETGMGDFLSLLKNLGIQFRASNTAKSDHCVAYLGQLTPAVAELTQLKVMV